MALELARTLEQGWQTHAKNLRNAAVADDRIREHVRIVAGPQPYDHGHFAGDRFFRFDSATGTATNVYGQRLLRVTENFLGSLQRTLVRELGDRAASVLYDIGFRWGEADIKAFAPRIEREYECAFEKLAMGVMLESWWWPFRATGWGVWRYDFNHTKSGLVLVELSDSATAVAAGKSEKPQCHLYAGLFAALFSHLAQRELGCVELECAANGDSQCRFLVAARKRIEAATADREGGATIEEIVTRLAEMAPV